MPAEQPLPEAQLGPDQAGGTDGFQAVVVSYEDPRAVALVAAMVGFLDDLYRDVERKRRGVVADHFAPPTGTFVVVELKDEPVACGGIRACAGVGPGIGEVKRVWVEPHVRGRGLSRFLLGALEGEARALGYGELYLDTGTRQHAAMRLYETSGYRSIPNYGTNVDDAYRRSYAKRLA